MRRNGGGSVARPIRSAYLGRVGYEAGVELQHRVRQSILDGASDAADTLLLLEHPPTYTVGRNCEADDVLAAPDWLEQRGYRRRPLRPGRSGDVPRTGSARGLPCARPEAGSPQRARLRSRSAGGAGQNAGNVRRRCPGRRGTGADGRLGRSQEDRLDRHPPPPMGDDPRLRSECLDRTRRFRGHPLLRFRCGCHDLDRGGSPAVATVCPKSPRAAPRTSPTFSSAG